MNHRTHAFSDGSTKIARRLVAHRHVMRPRAWCLSWDFGATSVGAEGECSRRYFRTARAAKAHALRAYGEKAVTVSRW